MGRIFRGITTKYMIVFMMLIIVTVLVLGMIIAAIIANYSIDKKTDELSTSNLMFKSYYSSENGGAIETYLRSTEDELNSVLRVVFLTTENCRILVTDSEGCVVMHAQKGTEGSLVDVRYVTDGDLDAAPLSEWVLPDSIKKSIDLKGNVSMNSTCNGMLNQKAIWYASSLTDTEGNAEGYIISFNMSAGGDQDLFTSMIRSISLTALWLVFVMLVAIYVISYKVMTPLREMSNAAKSFARGKFDVRVPERGNDEVAELARSFNKMAIAVQSKDEMQKQFLSSVSHDLRTPMTTIAGFIDGILDGAIPKEKHEYYLEIIKNEVQRLSRLVISLLDVSRLQSGDRKFEFKAFNLCELARQTVFSFENQFVEKKLDVEFDFEKYDMYAYGDKDAITRVVYNLCHNAVKFSYDGGKYVVRIKQMDDEKLAFSVYNEGVGIPKEEIPFVFDRFYKTDKSRGLDKSGVGLGLFITKTIIDGHNGDIKVESEVEKWCEFTFTLQKINVKGEETGD